MNPTSTIEQALMALIGLAREEPDLAREEASARRVFFGGPLPAPGREAELAELRFAEWFLLERPVGGLDDVPVEALHGRGLLEEQEPVLASLRHSRAGVYQVTEVRAGQGFWLRDLFGGGEYPLQDPEASHTVAEGDLFVGRIYPIDDSAWAASRAAACFRDEALSQAVTRDAQRARETRRGTLRVAQSELERMFFRPPGPADPIAVAKEVLTGAGLDADRAEAVLARLARAPCDPSRWAHGAGDELGRVLDELAFETEVDLDRARQALLAAWPRLASPGPESSLAPSQGAASVAEAMRAFDDGRARGRDLEGLFRELEKNLGLEPEAPADSGPLPDFPGVVAAMVEEFLWESGLRHGGAPAGLDGLRELGRAAEGIGVFENLSSDHLLGFLTVWVPESDRFLDPGATRPLTEAVASFAAWAADSHRLEHLAGLGPRLQALAPDLDRVQRANAELPAKSDPEAGTVYSILAREHEGCLRLRAPDGGELTARDLPFEVSRHLAPGDRVRASADPSGGLTVLRCYPPQVAALEGGAL